jgi:hypothetical protein
LNEQAERIVYEESVRTLVQQRELLEGLRRRAGTLLGAASISTAFLSAQALLQHQVVDFVEGRLVSRPELGVLAWTAIVLFCSVVLLSLVVLIPWRWTFAHHPHVLIGVHLESEDPPQDWRPSSVAEIYRDISYWNGVHYDENGRKLRVLFAVFVLATSALAAELVIWLILLAG